MDTFQKSHLRKTLVTNFIIISISIFVTIIAIISSYQLKIFSEIRFPNIYYEFQAMYLMFLFLFVIGLNELVFVVYLSSDINLKNNISRTKLILNIVGVHILLVAFIFVSVKYTFFGSNASVIARSLYVFIILFVIDFGILILILKKLHNIKKYTLNS